MGWYGDHVLPRIVDKACGMKEMRPYRDAAVEGLSGEVLELGFGSGLNLPHLPDEVDRVLAVEPADTAWRLAEQRVASSPTVVERVGLVGEEIPLDDESVDAALSTFTLCTIPDVGRALCEVRRILRPGGRLHFLEHGLSPDERVARRQRRITPIQRRVAGGCHLDRAIDDIVTDAGFEIDTLELTYMSGPKPWGYTYRGTAHVP